MNMILRTVLVTVATTTAVAGLGGCATNKAGQTGGTDRVIQHYMQERSDLMSQRRRLAATYGADSPQVASVDRQITLVNDAMTQRRNQLIEQEQARQQVRQMKQEATPMPAASEPAR